MNNKQKHIWLGTIPEIGGYGISVISETKEGAEKTLKKTFYEMRRDWWYGQEYYTYKGAFEYFSGRIVKIYFDKSYDDSFRG
tara:strand:+ start:243 stop:488 length:246 start_codon:yes stop_codon:yes gene_type:complete